MLVPIKSIEQGMIDGWRERRIASLPARVAQIEFFLIDQGFAPHASAEEFLAQDTGNRRIGRDDVCNLPPAGWYCTGPKGHEGPCAAWPVTDAAPEVGWLIEIDWEKAPPDLGTPEDTKWAVWWDGQVLCDLTLGFTRNPDEAVRFARNIDAERVIDGLTGGYCLFASEHSWNARPE